MKVCNNCNTKNEVTAEKCIQCNMPGNFTLHAIPTIARPVIEKTKIMCLNCGSHDPGMESKCRHCHFPLAKTGRITPIHQRSPLNGDSEEPLTAHG